MSIKIDIISGFLGVGKTTFLNKILSTQKEKTVVIENEFGDVGIDGIILEKGIPVKEIASGCICCGLVGEFQDTIETIAENFKPETIVIEPSGVGRPGDIVKVCESISKNKNIDLEVRRIITIVDVLGYEESIDSFGLFYREQIQSANVILLSYLNEVDEAEKARVINLIREENKKTVIIEDDWYNFDGKHLDYILEAVKIVKVSDLDSKKTKLESFLTNYIFTSLSLTDVGIIKENQLKNLAEKLDKGVFGKVLRAKGILEIEDGSYVHFNYTPFHFEYTKASSKESKAVFIGSNLDKEGINNFLLKNKYN